MRKTKIVCTIGPKTSNYETLKKLAEAGMNVARLNMSHGTHEWHSAVVKAVRRINEKTNYSIAIMLDTKGPEVRTGDIAEPMKIKVGDKVIFSNEDKVSDGVQVRISYNGLPDDVKVGDKILIEGGLMSFEVEAIENKSVVTKCIDGGELTSRRHVNIVGKSPNLPSITENDWKDIKFGIEQGVDFIAQSFVRDPKDVSDLKEFLKINNHPIDVIAKIESADAMNDLEEIIQVSDGVMVARGDLGSELPIEDVPIVQDRMMRLAKKFKKPIIVATQMLESMMENPTPTRAEVSDIANAVRDRADAIMLSGETASGKYPIKSVKMMDRIACKIENTLLLESRGHYLIEHTNQPKDEIVRAAAVMANNVEASAMVVITRSGHMAALLSQCRPNSPIYTFTNTSHVRRRLNLYWGLQTYRIDFSQYPEKTIHRSIDLLLEREQIKPGDRVIIVSGILVGDEFVNTIQVREIREHVTSDN